MIPLIKSTFYKESQTKKALTQFIAKAEKLSFGEQCFLFEENFAKYHDRDHAILVNSGSSANLAIIQALLNLGRLQPGDRVGFSALTWSTNVMPIIQLGLIPVPIDVELDTLNVSSKTLSQAVLREQSADWQAVSEQQTKIRKKTSKTAPITSSPPTHQAPLRALFLTNLLGFCDDLEQIELFCQDHSIILLEDNCESLGSVYQSRKLGNFSLASTCSFYVGHHLSTIEGGMVITDDEELATMVRIVRAHGWDRNLSLLAQDRIRTQFKVNSTFYSRYTFYDLGYNLRPTEIAGFLGNLQLQLLPEIIEKRQANFLEFAPKLYQESESFHPMRWQHMDVVSNFAVPVVCRTTAQRDELVARCEGKLEIRPIVGGDMTQQPFFVKYLKRVGKKGERDLAPKQAVSPNVRPHLPNAQLIHQQGLYFGNNPELTVQEKKQIFRLLS